MKLSACSLNFRATNSSCVSSSNFNCSYPRNSAKPCILSFGCIVSAINFCVFHVYIGLYSIDAVSCTMSLFDVASPVHLITCEDVNVMATSVYLADTGNKAFDEENVTLAFCCVLLTRITSKFATQSPIH